MIGFFVSQACAMHDCQERSAYKVDRLEVNLDIEFEREIRKFYPKVSLFDIKRAHLVEFLIHSRNIKREVAEKACFVNESCGESFEVLIEGEDKN